MQTLFRLDVMLDEDVEVLPVVDVEVVVSISVVVEPSSQERHSCETGPPRPSKE